MKLILTKWQVLVFLGIMSILAGGCTLQPLPITLKADRTVVSPGGDTSIECIVSNSTGNVNYKWSCNGGSVQAEGESADWLAPDSLGDYAVKVVVKRDNGGWGTAAIIITVKENIVKENIAPIIEDFVLPPEKPGYFKDKKILKGQKCDIECVARDEDGDELAYDWSCDNGEISGSGAKVTWTAPSKGGSATITVTVSDGNGGVASDSIVFQVVTCGCQI